MHIWLKDESPGMLRAMDYLVTAAKLHPFPLDHVHVRGSPTWTQKAKLSLRLLPPYLLVQLLFDAYRARRVKKLYKVDDFPELLDKDWFERAWTFQESVLASNSIILCGSRTLRWKPFLRGLGV